MVEFSSYNVANGTENRIKTTVPVNVTGRMGISIDFVSGYGNNCHLDQVHVTGY